jgi:hypothetical protein
VQHHPERAEDPQEIGEKVMLAYSADEKLANALAAHLPVKWLGAL